MKMADLEPPLYLSGAQEHFPALELSALCCPEPLTYPCDMELAGSGWVCWDRFC